MGKEWLFSWYPFWCGVFLHQTSDERRSGTHQRVKFRSAASAPSGKSANLRKSDARTERCARIIPRPNCATKRAEFRPILSKLPILLKPREHSRTPWNSTWFSVLRWRKLLPDDPWWGALVEAAIHEFLRARRCGKLESGFSAEETRQAKRFNWKIERGRVWVFIVGVGGDKKLTFVEISVVWSYRNGDLVEIWLIAGS